MQTIKILSYSNPLQALIDYYQKAYRPPNYGEKATTKDSVCVRKPTGVLYWTECRAYSKPRDRQLCEE